MVSSFLEDHCARKRDSDSGARGPETKPSANPTHLCAASGVWSPGCRRNSTVLQSSVLIDRKFIDTSRMSQRCSMLAVLGTFASK